MSDPTVEDQLKAAVTAAVDAVTTEKAAELADKDATIAELREKLAAAEKAVPSDVIPADKIRALLDSVSHDVIGRAFTLFNGVNDLVKAV
jgi:hypothetical protein